MLFGNQASEGKKPTTPTIGTATDGGTGTTVSVAFTPSTYIGKGTITYTATSSPGSLTGTGSGSPITVSGLTTGTAYTFTVKGDTNYGVASDSSAASNSVTPASPSSFESIATFTGNGTTSTYTFSSIPSTYKTLQIRCSNIYSSGSNSIRIQLNGDTGNNYAVHKLQGDGTSATAVGNTAQPYMYIDNGGYGSNTYPQVSIIDFIDYASTSKNKTMRNIQGVDKNGSGVLQLNSGLWINTAAINSITILTQGANFSAGTTIALYGIKG